MPNSFNFFLILMASLATGCAHSIQLAPDLDDLRMTAVSDPIDKNVGYYISVADRTAEVVTPGGGGDDVKYFPYKTDRNQLLQFSCLTDTDQDALTHPE